MDASAVGEALRIAGQVPDPRRHNRVHLLSDMILMTLCAVLCGADSWLDVQQWCDLQLEWLATWLTLRRGVPSHDTFGRVFGRLDPLELEKCLSHWLAALQVHSPGKHLAVDGKAMRRSFKHAFNVGSMAHLASAYAGADGVVLGQVGYDEKEGELEAIKKLLAMLDLKGCTVSIDALGCQKEVAGQIVAKQGNYVLCVKGNQRQLFTKVKTLLKEAVVEKLQGWKASHHQETCAGHGRIETRDVWCTSEVEHLGKIAKDWPGLAAVAVVQCRRQVHGQEPTVQRRYYLLSDASLDAQQTGRLVRGHWTIENGLHYVLDMSFDEDHCRVRKDHGAENLSRMRRLTANLLRRVDGKASIRCKRKCCGWSREFLAKALLAGLGSAT